MAAISIRNLDDRVRERLRVRAASHGRSMEAEIRQILADAVSEPGKADGLFAALVARVAEAGGAELDVPRRAVRPRSADLPA